MKKSFILSGILSLTASVAMAAPQIKINSWAAIGQTGSEIAEICGTVTGATESSTMLTVTVDYNTKNPGIYHTVAGTDGNFCLLVRTFVGTVQVDFMSGTAGANAKAVAQLK